MDTKEMAEEAEDLREQAKNWQRRAKETAVNATQATDQYVRENPWMTVGVAMLAGCLIGYMLGRSGD